MNQMIYAVYHHPGETMGFISEVLWNMDLPYKCLHLYRGDGLPRYTSDLDALIVMGGPMSVNDTHYHPFFLEEVRLLERVLADDKPVLGICLGAQLMAKALEARVYDHSIKEVGWHQVHKTDSGLTDPLLKKTPDTMKVFHWHGETFELPKGAVQLFRSDRCENQGFRWGKNCYGFQFHLEVTPHMVQEWCSDPAGSAYICDAGEDPKKIIEETHPHWNRLKPFSNDIFSSFFKSSLKNLIAVQ